MVLVVVEHDRGALASASLEALSAARFLGAVEVLTIGEDADSLSPEFAPYGVGTVHQTRHSLLFDYGPEAWGEVIAQAARALKPSVVVAAGTDRGNEMMAHAAARLDLPFAANVVEFAGGDPLNLTRVRWGGSLLEQATLNANIKLVTVARHAVVAQPALVPGDAAPVALPVSLPPELARTVIAGRVERAAGVTLATASVVVGGGRGVGSAAGFAPLEELAAALGGVVGCSRAVTNSGWRNHADQVGQTGTRIAPDVYLACGISGAIQHWVGAMASKHIIAINIDNEANMVRKAGYAVIGDLHQIVPSITAEIRRRRTQR